MKQNTEKTSAVTLSSKSKKIIIAITAVILVIAITLGITLPILLRAKEISFFRSPESLLPTEEAYALNKYSYEELSDNIVTLRSDSMTVTKRNLPRPVPQLLSNDFSLTYDTQTKTVTPVYGQIVPSSATLKTATITFTDYASPSHAVSGANAFVSGTSGGAAVDASNSAFYKYMLMTQGQHLDMEARTRSANGTLTQDWLKKHPAADAQYGRVLGENNAVEKEIILDPLYRSPHVTGLYLPAGEVVTVKIEGLAQGERLSIGYGTQDSLAWRGGANDAKFNEITGGYNNVTALSIDPYFVKADVLAANGYFDGYVTNQSQWTRQVARAPWLHGDFYFNGDGEYTIGSAFGGALQIYPQNCYSRVKVTITGAVETPHYILGTTTPEYFDEYLRQAPGVIAIMDTENGELIGPTGEMGTNAYMRQIKKDEVDRLAMLWHSFLSVHESFTGGTYNRYNKVMFDWHVPAGAAVSLGNYSFAHPTGWFNGAMNYRGLLAGGTWGIMHEIGHNHGASYGSIWGFGTGQEGEVRNNALTVLAYIMMGDMGTTLRNGTGGVEHGETVTPYTSLGNSLNFLKVTTATDFETYGYFPALRMYTTIMHSFGAEKFYELLYTYKGTPSYAENRRADFAYRCSSVFGMNFLRYFNVLFKANITDDMFSDEQLAFIKSLPSYEPVANFYAGGIDGVKTAGDYIVSFGEDITFDMLATTISSLDTDQAKGFDIIGFDQPAHGKLTDAGDGKFIYSFNPDYTGALDEFSFYVCMNGEDKTVHKLTVYLRIGYNGSRVTAYPCEQQINRNDFWNDVNRIIAETQGSVSSASVAGVPSYNTGKTDGIRVSEFFWKAPKDGKVSFSAVQDDRSAVYCGKSFEELQQIFVLEKDNKAYPAAGSEYITVKQGETLAFRAINVNTGGGGYFQLGYKYEDDEQFVNVPATQVYHPNFPSDKPAPEPYVYEPKYILSKKANIKISTTGTDKSDWVVVQAPENIAGGRYEEQQQIDNVTGEVGGVMVTDKWTYLIDGVAGTILHTAWQGNVSKITPANPHVFVVDTSRVQPFNYVSVTTRNNVNSYMTDWEIQIAESMESEWKTVGSGDRDSYVGQTVTVKFPQVNARYVRVVVKGTTGGTFSVLAEIDAGVSSATQRVLSPNSDKLFATRHWQNSRDVTGEASGYLMVAKRNQKVVAKFSGTSFALYAATGTDYGAIKIRIDGKTVANVDLNSNVYESRKLVANLENLSDKEHTVEIITTNSGKVMLSVLGVPYSANLLNASNIYLERGLGITLAVFAVLFAAALAFVIVLLSRPKFREKVLGSKVVKAMEQSASKSKKEKSNVKKGKVNDSVNKKMEEITAKAKPAKQEKAEEKPAPKVKTDGNVAAKEKNVKQGKVDESVAKKMADINAKSKASKGETAVKASETKSAAKPASKAGGGKK